jgi:hypothetical protein
MPSRWYSNAAMPSGTSQTTTNRISMRRAIFMGRHDLCPAHPRTTPRGGAPWQPAPGRTKSQPSEQEPDA